MKYLLCLLVLLTTVTSQGQCQEFDNLLKKGDNILRGSKPNYQEAINAYTAAILACSDRAGEAKQRLTKMVIDISKLKDDTQAALEKANASTVALLLENANRDILNLHYEDALQKIKTAASLGALKPEVAKAYLEISFWHGESGNIGRAKALLDSIADFMNNPALSTAFLQTMPADTAAARNRLREALKLVDPDHFKFLFEQKYYPDMVFVEGGKFMMGCDSRIDTNCPRDVTLYELEVSSFRMARTETTVWQFALYCAANKLDMNMFLERIWSDPGDNPVVHVNWYDTLEYANWLSKQKGAKEAITKDKTKTYAVEPRGGYRLPTESEWEYAAKGGSRPDKTIYSGSSNLDDVGWYFDSKIGRTHAVGKKKANSLGLYDMSGNAVEWCWDRYDDYEQSPVGLQEGSFRVVRGGCWYFSADYCRTASRDASDPDEHNSGYGFRLVFVP